MDYLKGVLKDIGDSICEGFIVLDKDKNVTFINERAKILFGCEYGKNEDKVNENIKRLNFKEQICNGKSELNIKLKIGDNVLIVNKIPININGIIKGAIGIFQDNKVQRNFLDINSSYNILNTIMDTTRDCVVAVDKDGVITMMSKCYKEFLKCENPEGKYVDDVIDNTRLPFILKSGNIEYGDVQIIRGKEVVAMRAPIKIKGEIIGAIGKIMFRDIEQLNLLNNKVTVLKNEVEFYKSELGKERISKYSFDNIIGISKKALEVKRICKLLAKTDSTVLIVGESGTGKEIHASAIHNASKRSLGAFIKINCGAIPNNLIESELFGYDEGAFTGAKRGGKKGKFELADGGTIFLDEIGEMPIDMQVRLLRVIQEKEVERVGGNTLKKIDIRIIAATNIDLEEAVKEGRFRRDLYYRLNVMKVEIPPLRERKEDIELLADSLRVKVANKLGLYVEGISKKAIDILKNHNWPGNIRELENVIERAINLLDSESLTIEPKHLPKSMVKNKYKNIFREERTLSEIIESVEKRSIERCLKETKWNKNKTAKLLGISRANLYKKIEKYNIEKG